MIRLEHLNKYFNRGRQNEIHVINDVSLELPERGMVAVFGRSGCGKTTLLNVIGGLDGFTGGTLTVNGQNIREDTDSLRNREMGYIFQNYNLCAGESCYDNVANALRLCGMKDGWQMRERVTAALANVGMENFSARTPDTLSGGQQQRIAIARAIVKNPRVILADEPTGNLDEANTILVMNLLKEISRDHLVLLVTHEADLVDHYCDTVIELSDGRVVNIRNNENAAGLRARDKNDIFLGELEKQESSENGLFTVDYYGEKPQTPVRLRVVNSGGKLYLRVDTAGVQVLDDTSEVKLREGVFEAHNELPRDGERVDMSKLPPVEGSRYGRLYTFRSAVRSGWRANFSRRKKGKKFLLALMTLFSAVLVLMTSLFGTSFRTLFEAKSANSANTFYLYTPEDGAVSDRLLAALDKQEAGIDDLILRRGYGTPGDQTFRVKAGYFETFTGNMSYGTSGLKLEARAVALSSALAAKKEALAGKTDSLEPWEIVVSARMAELLLESSTVGYLRSQDDLIGLPLSGMSYTDWSTGRTHSLVIAGVAAGSESVLYIGQLARAQSVLAGEDLAMIPPVRVGYEKEIASGSAVIWAPTTVEDKELPAVGKTIQVHGVKLTVSEVLRVKLESADSLSYYAPQVLVNAEDYIRIASRTGATDALASQRNFGYDYGDDIVYEGASAGVQPLSHMDVSSSTYGTSHYTAIHSSNPAATEAWLKENFSSLAESGVKPTLWTPDDLYQENISDSMTGIVSSFISMGVIVAILCVCVYFIMRSSLMKSIREVGIYRAIGVTRRNLIYRFFIESAVLTALTTLVGFLLSSTVMRLWLHATPLMERIFYYPLWLSGALMVLIVGVCLLCGILPALTLLHKTPSEILAKYDI